MSDQLLVEALATIDRLDTRLVEAESQLHEPIAIIGVGCRFPEAEAGPSAFWALLDAGADASKEITRWKTDTFYDASRTAGKSYTKRASLLLRIDEFEPSFFQITPREAEAMDPQQRLLLEVAYEAVDAAAVSLARLQALSTGVFIGIGSSDYTRPGPETPPELLQYASIGNMSSVAAGRISYVFGLSGPCMAIDTSCSSSLVAVHTACESLRLKTCDIALAGGVSVLSSSQGFVVLSSLTALAPDGRSKAWDASADGYGRGEGCGMVVLKRLSDARRDGDQIWAVIRGSAINSDGHSSGLTAPNPEAQANVIRTALARSGVESDAVQYIEAHGTGTVLGDPIEVEALASAFSPRTGAPLAIGTVKTNIGHLEAGAGIAGLIKTALAVHHRELPATLHFKTPNPHIDWETIAVRVRTERGPWPDPSAPLIAGVSSFGLSGTNAHVIVAEAPLEDEARAAEAQMLAARNEPHVLVVSAKTDPALRDYATRYAAMLEATPGDDRTYRDLAYTTGARSTHHEHRLAIVGASCAEWAAALRGYLAGDISERVVRGTAPATPRRVAMVFGGQGSQWYAMGRELLRDEPVFRAAIEEVAAHIDRQVSWKLVDELTRDEATSRIDDTEIAQPALFALHVGLVKLWAAWGVEPRAVLGHSLGEISAAHVAGALTLEQAARLVVVRGQILQRATGLGRMATVSLGATDVAPRIAGVEGVEIAASNGPRSTTICGPATAIDRAIAVLGAAGVDAKALKVNYAFHHAMLAPLAAELTAALGSFAPASPRLLLMSTITGDRAPRVDAAYWGDQVRQRVRFEEATRALLSARYDTVIEIGAHPVLIPAIAQTAEDAPVVLVPSLRRREPELATMRAGLGALHCSGVAVDWSKQFVVPGRVTTRPSYPWQRKRHWLELAQPRPTSKVAPMIDRRTELPHAPGTHLFELDRGEPITVAALIELAAESVAQTRGEARIDLRDVKLERAAANTEPRNLQLVLHAGRDVARFEIFARGEDGGSAERLGEGRIGGAATSDEWSTLAELQRRCVRDATDDRGDSDTILDRVQAGDREALGQLRAPGAERYDLDPAILTATCHMIGTVVGAATYVPMQLAALTIVRRAAPAAWIYARWSDATDDGARTADVLVLDKRGQMIAEARGVRLEMVRTNAQVTQDRWLYRVGWRESTRSSPPDARGPWLVFADRGGVGAALRAALETAGQRVVTVDRAAVYDRRDATHFEVLIDDPAHMTRVLDDAFATEPPRRIVHLWSLDAAGDDAVTADSLVEASRLSVASASSVVQALAKRGWNEVPRLFLVTRGAQSTRDNEAVPGFTQSMMWGLGASLVHEMPELAATLIDLDPARDGARELYEEVTRADGEDRIALRAGERRMARLERYQPQPTGATVVRSDRTYLVTGGLGGLGLVIADKLVAQGARHVALMGRSAPDSRARATIAALEGAGATVRVVRGDVADTADVARVLDDVRATMPALGGVVHAAGVFDGDTLLAMKEPTLRLVLAPKVTGTWHLAEQTAGDELEMFVVFSSVSAFLGLPQAHYAAANAFLDGFSQWRRGRGLVATSMNWGPWGEVGVGGRGDQNVTRQGLAAIPSIDGAELFVRLAGDRAVQVAVMDVRWRQWRQTNPRAAGLALLADQASVVPTATIGSSAFVEQIRTAPESQRTGLVAQYVRGTIGKVSGMPAAQIRSDIALTALGLDSLMMVSLKNVFERDLALTVSTATLYAYPNVKELAAWITGKLCTPAVEAASVSVAPLQNSDVPSSSKEALLAELEAGGYLDD